MFGFATPGLPSFGDLAWHAPVNAYMRIPLPANTLSPNSAPVPGQTLTANANGPLLGYTGDTLAAGSRFLVAGEPGTANGIYRVVSVGSAGSPWQLIRATDADTLAKLPLGSVTICPLVGVVLFSVLQPYSWQSLPQEVADGLMVAGGNLSVDLGATFGGDVVVGGALSSNGLATLASLVVQGTRPASAAYSFLGALATATGTTILNLGNLGGSQVRMPWAGRIVGVDISPSTNRTGGTATAHATVNGVQKNVLAPQLGAGTASGTQAVAAYAAADTFAAGDQLRANVVTSGYAPLTGNVAVTITVVFDAVG